MPILSFAHRHFLEMKVHAIHLCKPVPGRLVPPGHTLAKCDALHSLANLDKRETQVTEFILLER